MKIAMFTNTFTPHVGGVARSVSGLCEGLRALGHAVLVVAPEFAGMPDDEPDVIRVPAVQRFGGTDFSVPLPATRALSDRLDRFAPDIVHSHHPFLLGDTALRVSAFRDLPIVFTYHTRYELYGHYVAQDSEALKRLVQSLSFGYCELCNAVIAPSRSIADYLERAGVTTPVSVIPTGIDTQRFAAGDRRRGRRRFAIPAAAQVIGHVGRLAPEKSLDYLAEALVLALRAKSGTIALIVGDGASRNGLADALQRAGLSARVHFTGVLTGQELVDAYASMDVFAFSSLSETQGLVLAEAMAAGIPVIALDAPGAREVVRDGMNGRLLDAGTAPAAFAAAIAGFLDLTAAERRRAGAAATRTASGFSAGDSVARVAGLYDTLCGTRAFDRKPAASAWQRARRSLEREAEIIGNYARAVGDAVLVAPQGCAKRVGKPVNATMARLARGFAVWAAGLAFAATLRLWAATWRTDTRQLARLDAMLAAGDRVLAVFWHGEYFPLFALVSGRPALVLAGRSFRGEVIAEICRRFGYTPLLVEHRQHGFETIEETVSAALPLAALALDGPLGPFHRVKPGAVRIASDLGYRILPVRAESHPRLTLSRRWDRRSLPLPFAKVRLHIGDPLDVPAGLPRNEVEAWQKTLGERMDALDAQMRTADTAAATATTDAAA